jgi:hypothetical protein
LSDLGIDIDNLLLVYGDHKGKPELREVIAKEANLRDKTDKLEKGLNNIVKMINQIRGDK